MKHISVISTFFTILLYVCVMFWMSLSVREKISPFWLCVCSKGRESTQAPTGLFIVHSHLPFCYAEWWLNNMHYPRHQPQGSIFAVLLVRPGSQRSDGVSFPAYVWDGRHNFHSPTAWNAWGKGQCMAQMKRDSEAEDEGICRLNICVNGTLDFTFPISALMICLRLLPRRSALPP